MQKQYTYMVYIDTLLGDRLKSHTHARILNLLGFSLGDTIIDFIMESRVIYTKNRIYWSNASVRNFKTYYDRTFSSQEFNIKEICNKSSYIKVSCISFLAYQDVMRFTVCEQSIKVTITSDLINFESLVKDYLI